MALTRSSRSQEVKPLKPETRLTMVFRELAINGKKSWKHWHLFARHAAETSPEMKRIIECFDGLKKREKDMATPEYVCSLAGVDPTDLAAEVFREYLKFAQEAANLIEAASRPDVVRKQVEFAKREQGWRDRQMLHQHSGFLPPRTNGGIHVSATAEVNNATLVDAGGLTRMESDTLRFTRALKDNQALTIEADKDELRPVPALGAPDE